MTNTQLFAPLASFGLLLFVGCASSGGAEPADAIDPSDDDTGSVGAPLVAPGGGGDVNPCALVLCPPEATCNLVAGEPVCQADDEPTEPTDGPLCGGFAGIECPGAGSCIDDPSDDCDPDRGGADCSGICTCGNVLLLCIPGTVFDDSPDVCACMPEEPPVDACATVRCAAGTHCEVIRDRAACVPDAAEEPRPRPRHRRHRHHRGHRHH
jgi:hypothetical protein